MLIAHILREKGAEVFTVAETASLEEAARALDRRRVGCAVVLAMDETIAGILSERDIVREIARHGPDRLREPVSSAMTRGVIWADLDETLEECLNRMTDRRIRHLPVVSSGRLVGLVSIGDLVKHRIRAADDEAAAMRAYIATG